MVFYFMYIFMRMFFSSCAGCTIMQNELHRSNAETQPMIVHPCTVHNVYIVQLVRGEKFTGTMPSDTIVHKYNVC